MDSKQGRKKRVLVGSPDPTRKIEVETALTSETKPFRDRVSKEDEEFFAEYFKTRGYLCTKLDKDNQQKPSDSPKTPDYLLEKEGLKIYCEIKSMFEQKEFAKADEVADRLFSRLEELPYPYYFKLRIKNEAQLSSKEEKSIADLVANKLQKLGNKCSFPLKLDIGVREVEIELVDLNTEGQLRRYFFQAPLNRGVELRNTQRLLNYIKNSSKKFKNCATKGNSYVLIVFYHHVNLNRKPKAFYAYLKGIIAPDKNTTISAIALCERRERFIVFHNPYTKYPLDLKVFANKDNKQYISKEIKPDKIEFDFVGSEV